MRRGQKTSAKQVVLKLRQIEVRTAQGKSLALACKETEISEHSHYRWGKEYGGLKVDQTESRETPRNVQGVVARETERGSAGGYHHGQQST